MILNDLSLKDYNSFGINISTKRYISFPDETEIVEFIRGGGTKDQKFKVLGGGTNTLFTKDYPGLIIHPAMDQIKLISESASSVTIECGAGIVWDDLVEYAVDRSWGGIENLSNIPGSVGASPIQNIGAYGSEVKDTIESVRAVAINTGDIRVFSNIECEFNYRSSIFKTDLADKHIITAVIFKLSRDPELFNTSYGDVAEVVSKLGKISLRNIRKAITEIRHNKLPDPSVIGNAGSFFKNPVVEKELFEKIENSHMGVPGHRIDENRVKIPAGWLIEKCGWKGYRRGDTGVHSQQALVIVNYGNASGEEIYQLSEDIIESVYSTFGIRLEREVNIVR